MSILFRMTAVCFIAAGVFNRGGTINRGVHGKKGYKYSSSGDLIDLLRFVG
jgi:hypothetical protein